MGLWDRLFTKRLLIDDDITLTVDQIKRYARFVVTVASKTVTLPTPKRSLGKHGVNIENASDGNIGVAGDFAASVTSITVPSGGAIQIYTTEAATADTYHFAAIGTGSAAGLSVPVKCTGAEILAGTDDAKFLTPKGASDAGMLNTDTIASAEDINTGMSEGTHITPAGLAASNYASSLVTAENLGAVIAGASEKTTAVGGDSVLISDSEAATVGKRLLLSNLLVYIKTAWGAAIASLTGKTTPVAADSIVICDSEATNASKKLTFTNLLATFWTATWLGGLISGATAKTTPVTADLLAVSDSQASNVAKKSTLAEVWAVIATATSIGAIFNGASAKATPIDADMIGVVDTEASNVIKKTTFTQVKAFLKTYFDTLYTAIPTVATFTATLGWSGGSPTVTAEVYRQQTLNKMCYWEADIVLSNGNDATTMTLTFGATWVPTDVDMIRNVKCLVSVNNGAYVEKVATLDCADGTPANRKVTVSPGTLTTGQPARLLLRGSHEIA